MLSPNAASQLDAAFVLVLLEFNSRSRGTVFAAFTFRFRFDGRYERHSVIFAPQLRSKTEHICISDSPTSRTTGHLGTGEVCLSQMCRQVRREFSAVNVVPQIRRDREAWERESGEFAQRRVNGHEDELNPHSKGNEHEDPAG